MAWDSTIQKRSHIPPVRIETGKVVAGGVSGQDFTVATKFSRVIAGFGVMQADGLVAFATTGKLTAGTGTITFTRYGPIVTSADTIQYVAIGF
jgi:hypothetical protein